MKLQVSYEDTPNPQSLKFVTSAPICSETLEIKDRAGAARSPLAAKILGFPWAKSVFLGENFVTVTKEEWVDWDILRDPLSDLIRDHLQKGEKALLPKTDRPEGEDALAGAAKNGKSPAGSSESPVSEDSPAAKKIKQILEREIQPAVAMDGGYIGFVSYEEGKVYLSLQGACSGCPSSVYTLKDGIEGRLKQEIPEIQEVIPV